jgi:hypothetical protein
MEMRSDSYKWEIKKGDDGSNGITIKQNVGMKFAYVI